VLERHGFDFEGANVPGRPTFTFAGIIPHFMRPKLDWIAIRGMTAVRASAAVVPARNSIWAGRFSDHDFITCEIVPS
jgi:hypothetical protein